MRPASTPPAPSYASGVRTNTGLAGPLADNRCRRQERIRLPRPHGRTNAVGRLVWPCGKSARCSTANAARGCAQAFEGAAHPHARSDLRPGHRGRRHGLWRLRDGCAQRHHPVGVSSLLRAMPGICRGTTHSRPPHRTARARVVNSSPPVARAARRHCVPLPRRWRHEKRRRGSLTSGNRPALHVDAPRARPSILAGLRIPGRLCFSGGRQALS